MVIIVPSPFFDFIWNSPWHSFVRDIIFEYLYRSFLLLHQTLCRYHWSLGLNHRSSFF
jgi:hypothetical protein